MLVRMIDEGHAIGNHLWQHVGNTLADEPSMAHLAEQYLQCERRIHQMLAKTDERAYRRYWRSRASFGAPAATMG